MTTPTYNGHKHLGTVKPSRQFEAGRTCAEVACTVLLSQYNKQDKCSVHAPTRYPRLRGKVAPE